jgi:hypothetical protein
MPVQQPFGVFYWDTRLKKHVLVKTFLRCKQAYAYLVNQGWEWDEKACIKLTPQSCNKGGGKCQ